MLLIVIIFLIPFHLLGTIKIKNRIKIKMGLPSVWSPEQYQGRDPQPGTES